MPRGVPNKPKSTLERVIDSEMLKARNRRGTFWLILVYTAGVFALGAAVALAF